MKRRTAASRRYGTMVFMTLMGMSVTTGVALAARTWYVSQGAGTDTSCASGGTTAAPFATIGFALACTSGGDTVSIDGTPAAPSYLITAPLVVTKSLTIVGTDSTGQGATPTIDGNHAVQVLRNSAGGKGLTVSNLQITDGLGDYGGGIRNLKGGVLTLNHVIVNNSSAISGGGIYNEGTLSMSGGSVNDNTATGGPSSACSISPNGWRSDGGGIYNAGGSVTLTGVDVAGNVATTASNPYPSAPSGGCATGGAIFSTNAGSLTLLSGTDVNGNRAIGGFDASNTSHGTGSASGGGIFVYNGSAVIDLSMVRGNVVQCNYVGCSVGGGIVNLDTLTVQNRTSISGNYSAGTLWGGGIYTSSGASTTLLAPVSITGNSATEGGGLYNYTTGVVTFKSTKSNKVTSTDITLSGNQPDQCGPATQSGTYSYAQGARTTNGTGSFVCPSP